MSDAETSTSQSVTIDDEETSIVRKLFVASFLSLFVELLLIRWIPSTVHVVGFFNNLVLIGCFLGLGLGMAAPIAVKKAGLRASIALTLTVLLLGAMNWLSPTIEIPEGADYSLNEFTMSKSLPIPLTAVLVCIFGLVVLCAIPFGQLVAAYFDKLPRLQAYSVNIAGSLAGVLCFSLIAWMSLPPYYWFGVVLLAIFHLTQEKCNVLILVPIFAVLFLNYLQDYGQFTGRRITNSRQHRSRGRKVIRKPGSTTDLPLRSPVSFCSPVLILIRTAPSQNRHRTT